MKIIDRAKTPEVKAVFKILMIISIVLITNIGYENNKLDYYKDRIYPKTNISNYDVSSLKVNELNDYITKVDNDLKYKKIVIEYNDKESQITLKDLGYKSNLSEIEKDIKKSQNKTTRLEKLNAINRKAPNYYIIDITLNNEKVNDFIDTIYDETVIYPTNPTMEINDDKINIIEGSDGIQLDRDKIVREIETQLECCSMYEGNLDIDAMFKTTKPEYSEEYLSTIDTKISSFNTNHNSSSGRKENLRNACAKVDNKVILPGEVFSYLDTVGPISSENGYKSAPVIANGKLVDGIGGGVCQVSSTIYNAQLRAGILPTERRNHSKSVAYVSKGLDATVASGVIDYQFENTLDYPILIKSYITNNSVCVEFWSNSEAMEGVDYKPVSYVSGKVANTYLYSYDKSGNELAKLHVDTSVYR